MKILYLVILISFICFIGCKKSENPTEANDNTNEETVNYEGKTYHTVKIGEQIWLKENLDIGTMIDSMQDQSNNGIIEKYCYNNDPANCSTYGGLYQWNEAMMFVRNEKAQGICPSGWHIPTLAEFQTLATSVGDDGNKLKREDQGTGSGKGTNESGFSALLSGYRDYDGYFCYLGSHTNFWSSTENNTNFAYFLFLSSGNGIDFGGYFGKSFGFSVRCLKD